MPLWNPRTGIRREEAFTYTYSYIQTHVRCVCTGKNVNVSVTCPHIRLAPLLQDGLHVPYASLLIARRCVCMSMHVWRYGCIQCLYACMYVSVRMDVCTYVCVYVCESVYVYVCMYTYVCMYVCPLPLNVCMHLLCMSVYEHIHKYMYECVCDVCGRTFYRGRYLYACISLFSSAFGVSSGEGRCISGKGESFRMRVHQGRLV